MGKPIFDEIENKEEIVEMKINKGNELRFNEYFLLNE